MKPTCPNCGGPRSYDAQFCRRCASKFPRQYDRTGALMATLEPYVNELKPRGLVAVKSLTRRILGEISLKELGTNLSTVSWLVRRILEEQGYVAMPRTSHGQSLWMVKASQEHPSVSTDTPDYDIEASS